MIIFLIKIAPKYPCAFPKNQVAVPTGLPAGGTAFISSANWDKGSVVPIARQLAAMGFNLRSCTGPGTRCVSRQGEPTDPGSPCRRVAVPIDPVADRPCRRETG
jgi:hypothetical protein